MEPRKGLTLPNLEWFSYSDDDLRALGELAPQTLVVLTYGSFVDAHHRVELLPYLADHPRTKLLIRPYATDIPRRDPAAWAARCWQDVEPWRESWPGTVELLPDNERNLAVEGGSEDWPAHVAWLSRFHLAWEELAPEVPAHLSALSPSGNYLAGHAHYRAAGLGGSFTVVDAHGYGDGAAGQIAAVATLWEQPVCVTEFNRVDPRALAAAVGDAASDLCWFLLGGTPDQAAYDLVREPTYYASYRSWPGDSAEAPAPSAPAAPPPGHPTQPTQGGHVISDAEFARIAKDVFARARVPFDAADAFTKHWMDRWRAGTYLGQPEGPTQDSEDGTLRLQRFASAVLWAKDHDWQEIHEDALPLG